MVNAQEWLDENYPKEERNKVPLLYLNEPNLEGELDLVDFTKLERVDISQSVDENKISFKNKNEEIEVKKCVDAQTWLDEWYPKDGKCKDESKIWDSNNSRNYKTNFGKTRNQISELSITGKGLEGSLDLTDFRNLEKLDCVYNHLTNLNLNDLGKLKNIKCQENKLLTSLQLKNCSNVDWIIASDNNLTDIDVSSSKDKITSIYLNDNPQLKGDLNIFKGLKNLQILCLNNTAFVGSLESLQNLSELACLNIADTDIDSGLEYLPNSIEYFYCLIDKRKNARCQVIYDLLVGEEQGEIEFDEMKAGEEYEEIKYKRIKNFDEKLLVIKNRAKERFHHLFRDELTEQSNKIKELTEKLHLSQSQLQQLSDLILPNQVYDFFTLKKEVQRIKTNELAPSLQNKRQELEQLITDAKNQLSEDLKSTLELYCQTLTEEDNSLKEGKLAAYQTILQAKLNKEELKTISSKKVKISQLEKQLNKLQVDEQQLETQVEVLSKGNS